MAVWIISDLHLSLAAAYVPGEEPQLYKPMEVFGELWQDHLPRLYRAWQERVAPEDTVLLPGDLSWAMHLAEAAADFAFLGGLPGRLLLSKGNHDLWWESRAKAQAALPPNCRLLQNEAAAAEGFVVAPARGWYAPGSADFDSSAAKIWRRELIRLEMSLKSGRALMEAEPGRELIVMLHFPPFNDSLEYNEMIELMQTYGVRRCYYGHLHGRKTVNALQGSRWGIYFRLVSADYLGHTPLLVAAELF